MTADDGCMVRVATIIVKFSKGASEGSETGF